MRLSIFTAAWTGYLASKLPCHPTYLTWSREHVIPKSIIADRRVTEDPQNIIPLPTTLNNARANLPYTNDSADGYPVYSCAKCVYLGACHGAGMKTPLGFVPPNAFKGPIARSALTIAFKYPIHAHTINDKVLNLETAIQWDRQFPMSKEESDWIRSLD